MKRTRIIQLSCIILSLWMVISVVGCSKTNSGKGGDSTAGRTPASDEKDNTKEKGKSSSYITDKKITLSILTPEWTGGQVGNDMPVYQEMEKRTNIHLDFQLLPLTDPLEKFNLIMGSDKLPDILGFSNGEAINKYGMEGAFIPLQDLIEKYAPDIKKQLDDPLPGEILPYKQSGWGEATAGDGNVYTIPLFSSSNAIGAVYAIRVDWLEKLDKKMPETADELYDVLKAFREQDPNGNQKQDEIPLVAGQGGKTARIIPLINAFDAHMNLHVDPKDDTIKYGPVENNYQEGLSYLNKLYREKLLEEDYLTSTNDQWLARATGNQAGLMFVWPASGIGAANNGLQKLDSSYKFMPMAPLKSKSGAQFKDTNTAGRMIQPRMAISITNKYPEETMKLFNYCFTEDGTRLISYGIEGKHYNMIDGKPVYTEYVTHNPDGLDPEAARVNDGLLTTALPYQMGWDCHFQAHADADPWTVEAWKIYREPGMVEAPLPTLNFTEKELSRKNQLVAEIDTFKDPMIDKFIMGVESLDRFNDFVKGIKRAGLDELLEIYNTAYKRYQKTAK
ncbi:extracellular solute-binding protein [Eubacteriales bacterium mix99]|nr:hypothetical protein [Clostridiales bacterium]